MKSYKNILLETSLARVFQHTKDSNIGMITASRGENTPEENKAGNKELEKSIKAAGHGYVKVKGRYVEGHGTPQAKNVDEHSFLVIGKKGDDKGELKNFLLQHGEKHGQDSILHKAHDEPTAKLHGTNEGGWPGKGEEHDVGVFHPNRVGEFHTAMKGNRTFAFESFQLEDVNYKTINAGDGKPSKGKEPLVTVDGKQYTAKELAAMKAKQNKEIDWKDKLKEGMFDFLKPKTQAQKNLPVSSSSSIVNDTRSNSSLDNRGNKIQDNGDSIPYVKPDIGLDKITNPRKYAKPDNTSNATDPRKKGGLSLVDQESPDTERRKQKADADPMNVHNSMKVR